MMPGSFRTCPGLEPIGANLRRDQCREFLPAPLWGGVGGGGREMWHLGALGHDPPPRGEGVRLGAAAPNLARMGTNAITGAGCGRDP
jgi:hypothetical protein